MQKKKKKFFIKDTRTRLYLLSLIQKKKKITPKKKTYKHKYKKPPFLRKINKKFRTLLFFSNNDFNFFYKIKDKYHFKKGFYLRLMPVWRRLYSGYIQFFFGVSKKPLDKTISLLAYKSRGFWEVFKLLKKQLVFYSIFNFVKKKNKLKELHILNNGIIRCLKKTTRLKIVCSDSLIKMPTKLIFSKNNIHFFKKLYKWYKKKNFRLRKWQKKKFIYVCKSALFFNMLDIKKKLSYFLLKNFFFFCLNLKKKYIKIFINKSTKIKKQIRYFFFFKKKKIKLTLKLMLWKIRTKKFNFFKLISKKEFWFRTFWSKKKYNKKRKFKVFSIYYFLLKKNFTKKIELKYFKKFLQKNSWDFNLIKEFLWKNNISKNFIYKNIISLGKKKKLKRLKRETFNFIRKHDFFFFKKKKFFYSRNKYYKNKNNNLFLNKKNYNLKSKNISSAYKHKYINNHYKKKKNNLNFVSFRQKILLKKKIIF